jgi:hypothetical protein
VEIDAHLPSVSGALGKGPGVRASSGVVSSGRRGFRTPVLT